MVFGGKNQCAWRARGNKNDEQAAPPLQLFQSIGVIFLSIWDTIWKGCRIVRFDSLCLFGFIAVAIPPPHHTVIDTIQLDASRDAFARLWVTFHRKRRIISCIVGLQCLVEYLVLMSVQLSLLKEAPSRFYLIPSNSPYWIFLSRLACH